MEKPSLDSFVGIPSRPSLDSFVQSGDQSNIQKGVFNQPQDTGFFSRIGQDIQSSAQDVTSALTGEGKYVGQGTLQRATGATAAVFNAVPAVASETLPQFARTGLQIAGEATGGIIDWLGSKIGSTKLAQDFVTKHPDAAKTLENIAGVSSNLGQISGDILLSEGIRQGAIKAGELGKGATQEVKSMFSERQMVKEIKDITENISPKPTAKEARLAQKQGRLIKGKEPTLLRGGKPDVVLPSNKVSQAAETIQKTIPNASKMSESDLYTSLKYKIKDIARQLEPEMKKVPIDRNITGKAFDAWKTLKSQQADSAEFIDNEAGNIKLQSQFESRLKNLEWDIMGKEGKFKTPTPKTVNDLWKSATEYDQSIPEAVKKATSLSDSKLQFRKQMWLDNRSILRDMINDSSTGLGDVSKKAFSDMHDMYMAQENIMSKTKIETSVKPSKLVQIAKDHPYIVGIVAGGAASALGMPQKVFRTIIGQ